MRFSSAFDAGVPVVLVHVDGAAYVVPGAGELGIETDLDFLRSAASSLGPERDPAEFEPRPVVPNPRHIVCLGLNYAAHIDETGREHSDYPVLFAKWASSLTAAGAEVPLPPESEAVDYEAELAVVIGREGRRIEPADALSHVAGVTIANDVTMRDYQYKTHQWLQGKAWESSTPLGPELVTLDEVGDLGELEISLKLNGETMQQSSTSLLVFDVPTIVAIVSEFTRLEPGDVLLTGTPGGVGFRRDPKVLLAPGDETVVEISGLGTLSNRFVAEPAA